MSVSIVAAPCLRFVHAALWNGQAPQMITGAARASEAHCQYVNCSAGIIAIAITGTVSTIAPISRCRSEVSSLSSSSPASVSDMFAVVSLGLGSAAVYPVFSTSATSSDGS
ncbi:Uncharacterised protein [Mycobacteroides abscessus subsp. abscessus]|nr:Uncharacterised protein [Mycobacteroides abscessus subsp. abscessus]